MAKATNNNFSTVINVDMQENLIRFISMTSGGSSTLRQATKRCRTKLFDKEFFGDFQRVVAEFSAEHPSAQAAGVTIVLPDRAIATNMITVPTLRRKKTTESLQVAINDLYKNASSLKINYHLTTQNRQFTSFNVSMIQNNILSAFYSACSAGKMIPQAVTFAANASVNAVQTLNPKLKNSTYIFMDIKSGYTRFSFVSDGHTCGYYTLPFGYSILEHYRLAAEDMLFDHSQAELLVLNAKEKAQAKSLTMMESETAAQMAQAMNEQTLDGTVDQQPADEVEEESVDIFAQAAIRTSQPIKTLPPKQPRKLPKFMVREVERTEEAYAYENFRLFVKWALNLLEGNQKQLFHDKVEGIYVNMPKQFGFLIEMANEEKKENGVPFIPFEAQGTREEILGNLESYGGFFTSSFNTHNNF